MGVLRPLKVVITNYPAGDSGEGGEGEMLEIPSYPHDVPLEGSRFVPFGRELFIEGDDFSENPPKGFHRLVPGGEVRLRYAYFIRCDEVVKDPDTGEVVELRCSYDPETKGGNASDGRKVKGTIHWVSARHGVPAEVRLYDRLFTVPDPEADESRDFTEFLNPESMVVLNGAFVEPGLAEDPAGTRYQFERQGYFMKVEAGVSEDVGPRAVAPAVGGPGGGLAFNRIVTLRDTWGKRTTEPTTSAEPDGAAKPASDRPIGESRVSAERSRAPGADSGRETRDRARASDPTLAALFARFQNELGLPESQADILTGSAEVAAFFDAAVEAPAEAAGAANEAESGSGAPKPRAWALAVANWIVNELLRELKGRSLADLPLSSDGLSSLVTLLEEGVISQPVAKDIFAEMVAGGVDPRAVVEERGLEKLVDADALKPMVETVLESNPGKVQEYLGGKKGLLGFFTGQVMKETDGKADPQLVQKLIREGLGES